MKCSSSSVTEQQLYQKGFLEILNQKDPKQTEPPCGGISSETKRKRGTQVTEDVWGEGEGVLAAGPGHLQEWLLSPSAVRAICQ